MNTRSKMLVVPLVVLIGLVLFSLSYGMWKLGKAINYRYSYQNMVREEIRQMVKKESLKVCVE